MRFIETDSHAVPAVNNSFVRGKRREPHNTHTQRERERERDAIGADIWRADSGNRKFACPFVACAIKQQRETDGGYQAPKQIPSPIFSRSQSLVATFSPSALLVFQSTHRRPA
jgi:hypothetical protein